MLAGLLPVRAWFFNLTCFTNCVFTYLLLPSYSKHDRCIIFDFRKIFGLGIINATTCFLCDFKVINKQASNRLTD